MGISAHIYRTGTVKSAAAFQSYKSRSIICRAALLERYLDLCECCLPETHASLSKCGNSQEQMYAMAKTKGLYSQVWQDVQACDGMFAMWYSADGLQRHAAANEQESTRACSGEAVR